MAFDKIKTDFFFFLPKKGGKHRVGGVLEKGGGPYFPLGVITSI